jgi:predicted Zn finger-like uncharacterized protein
MATTIVITCPHCKTRMKAPLTLAGKRVRCKACSKAFAVKAAPAGKGQAVKPGKKKLDDDDEGPPQYEVTEETFVPRCPDCANEMEEGDIICLHCGYNTQTRIKHQTRKIYETTVMDYVLHLAPAVACVLMIGALVGAVYWLWAFLDEIINDPEYKDAWWVFAPRGMKLWGTVFALAVGFFCFMFAFKRFVYHIHPPEKEKT